MQLAFLLHFICLLHLALDVFANSHFSGNITSKSQDINALAKKNNFSVISGSTQSTTNNENNVTLKSNINWSESRHRPRHYQPKQVQVRTNRKRSKKMLSSFLKPQVHPADSFYYNDLDHDDKYFRKRNQYDDEVYEHNIDSKHYPHQYSIQVRWGYPGQKRRYDDQANDYLSKDDENSRYRQYAHQEEEHWHDKKWIDIGTPPGVDHPPPEQYSAAKKSFSTLPVYARPMKHGASVSRIRQHFAVPSKSFPVNRRFVMWANSPVQFPKRRNSSYKRNYRSNQQLPLKRSPRNYRSRPRS